MASQQYIIFRHVRTAVLPNTNLTHPKKAFHESHVTANPMQMIYDACLATEKDFSPYDWNNDGTIDVVMVIYAGKGENRGGSADAIWPHKYSANGKVGALNLSTYACVSELAANGTTDGYGTFCHEFSHTLGLPDLYPVSGSLYSIFDEWDLMDGGNYSNDGYAAPNYSAFERHRCGWYDPVELKSATTISYMPSMDEECVAYKIVDPEDSQRYYLLENRQQQGFDYFLPGNGLIVTYVNHYDGTLTPNNSYSQQVTLITADNRPYHESESFFGNNKYTEDGHNRYLSLAGYPYVLRDSINNHLSDSSIPAMMFSGKPVSNIRMEDGNISFDFMKETSAIRDIFLEPYEDIWYDLQGRRLQGRPSRKGIYIHNYKKETIR